MAEGQEYCLKCGVPVKPASETIETGETVKKDTSGEFSVGLLIWSIVNLLMCNQIAGAIALVFALLAKDEEEVKAKRYNKISRITNIVGTALGVLAVVFVVIIYFLMFVMVIGMTAGTTGGYYY